MSDPDVSLYARAYLKAGLSIFPLDPGSKRPLGAERDRAMRWAPYQKARASVTEADSWFRPYSDGRIPNVAIVAGEVSGNLAILDFDSNLVWEQFIDLFPGILSRTKIARSGREPAGYHVYMLLPETAKSGYAIVPGEFDEHGQPARLGIDLQAEGKYCAAPPSLHPSGRRYEWFNPDVKRIGKFSSEELHGLAEALGGVWTSDQAGKTAHGQRGAHTGRPRNWVSALLGAGESFHDGDGRNRALTSLVGYLRSHVPLDIGHAVAVLWNNSLAEPMEQTEVDTIVSSAYRYGITKDPSAAEDYSHLENLEV